MQIVCVKIGSLSEFETFLLAENLGLEYLSLNEIRKDKTVRKYWFDATDGRLLAVERDIMGQKEFDLMTQLTETEIKKLKKSKPVLAGEPIRKFKGNIEEKREEFKELIEEDRKYRESMLNRTNYDPNDIVCINSRLSFEQVFSVCIINDVDPVPVISFIYGNSHLEMTRVWFEKETGVLVAYSYYEYDREYFYAVECLIPKSAIDKMSNTPVKTPKLKVTEYAISAYNKLKELGIELDIPKIENENIKKKKSDFLEKLQKELYDAIDTEDYEKAAEIRDRIKSIEK